MVDCTYTISPAKSLIRPNASIPLLKRSFFRTEVVKFWIALGSWRCWTESLISFDISEMESKSTENIVEFQAHSNCILFDLDFGWCIVERSLESFFVLACLANLNLNTPQQDFKHDLPCLAVQKLQ